MSKGPEQALKDKCHRWLRAEQAAGRLWYFKVHGSKWQRAGVPDFILCVNGRFLAVELKAGGGKVSPAQRQQIALIRKAGGLAGGLNSLEALKSAVSAVRADAVPGFEPENDWAESVDFVLRAMPESGTS